MVNKMIMKRTHSKSFFVTPEYVSFLLSLCGENPKNGDDDVVVLQIQMLAEEVFLLEIVKKEDYEFTNPPVVVDDMLMSIEELYQDEEDD